MTHSIASRILFSVLFLVLFVTESRAQLLLLPPPSYTYPEYTMEGDTNWFKFPPPDSTYMHNRIGIKFLTGVLDYSQLCYSCDSIMRTRTHTKGARTQSLMRSGEEMEYFSDCIETLLAQHFGLDVILDPEIRSILLSHGVTYLTRMTAANPCVDTVSISRLGDTVRINDFNMMIAYFNNDTSVIPTLTDLYLARSLMNNRSIEIAEPDYLSKLDGGTNTPADEFFADTAPYGPQFSLTMIGVNGPNGAWEYDVGDTNITVAIVDQGLDYQRCDLGQGFGSGHKVISGMNWPTLKAADIVNGAFGGAVGHGTGVASIVGAFTNWQGSGFPGLPNAGCLTGKPNGIAGIAGGWGPYPTSADERSKGVNLVGYNAAGQVPSNSSINVARSILDAANLSAHGSYGKGVDVINLSGGDRIDIGDSSKTLPPYSLLVRNAVAEAFYNAASFVAAKGDADAAFQGWPSSHEPASEVIAVGASDRNKTRYLNSHWGYNLDLIAPGDDDGGINSISLGIDYSAHDTVGEFGASGSPDASWFVGNTSGAAPHVSGVVALVRGYLTNSLAMPFAREDIEGMLKASCLDLGDSSEDLHNPRLDPDPPHIAYVPGYNAKVGYGFLQADTLFNMLDPAGTKAYHLFHVEIPHADLMIPHDWSGAASFKSQLFYQPTNDTGAHPGVTNCDVLRREITATFDYSTLGLGIVSLPTAPIYVWGNTGGPADSVPAKRGLASEVPNWEEPWCEVTSGVTIGYRGNNIVPGIAGIINNSGSHVSVHTYQFLLLKHGTDTVIDTIPRNADLGLGYTVFAPTKSTSGVREVHSAETFAVWPSIAATKFMATLNGDEVARSLELIDAVGRSVSAREFVPVLHHLEISVAGLPSGIYIARVMTKDGERDAKIIVKH